MNIPDRIKSKIEEIKEDTSSGAAELAKKAGDVFLEFSTNPPIQDDPNIALYNISKELIRAQPSMSPILNLVNYVLVGVENLGEKGGVEEAVKIRALEFTKKIESGLEEITRSSLELLGSTSNPKILAYSYSSTVLSTLLTAKKSGLEIETICTESRPTMEGRHLAEKLREAGIPVNYAVDMLSFSLIKRGEVDLVMVGADSISSEGLVNKIGTLGISAFARECGVPFYVLSGTEKFLPTKLSPYFSIESHPPKEVWDTNDEGISVINNYFDLTPLGLITAVITETGILEETELIEKIKDREISNQIIRWISS